jgi:hypothetical protein
MGCGSKVYQSQAAEWRCAMSLAGAMLMVQLLLMFTLSLVAFAEHD